MGKVVDAGDVNLDREVVRREDGTRITEADAEAEGRAIAKRVRSGSTPPRHPGGQTCVEEK